MQGIRVCGALLCGVLTVVLGCESCGKPDLIVGNGEGTGAQRVADRPAQQETQAEPKSAKKWTVEKSEARSRAKPTPEKPGAKKDAAESHREKSTAKDNPTARDGRGEPDLNDFFRPAAWVYVDGKAGKFVNDRKNKPQVHWLIEKPVGSSPTFRIEVYEPLLGIPKDMNFLLNTVRMTGDSPDILYAISMAKGKFVVGKEYSLLKPGKDFTVRNNVSGDLVEEIPPLLPGLYRIVAGVKNLQDDKEALAITYFRVAKAKGE